MNLHHIKTDNDNGTKYLEIALNNAIKAVENYETNRIILYNIPFSLFSKYANSNLLHAKYTFNNDDILVESENLNLHYYKTSCECVITSLAKSVKL